ncbi:hypothetical protein SPSIL_036320 [Sporomusa silvacetica DSM 10669]|uniref:DGC domain protein n=1 Tax=Sporomusa silvacetica DSM 10669 TaxID=1123289 RepID=A0ABZ3IPR0_9FIRM|nr:putative zinc-binding protein [Sporomusa silvacetica]OZC19815.1 DGC domain protein [Sporomusa silvacetica DSM 10669]
MEKNRCAGGEQPQYGRQAGGAKIADVCSANSCCTASSTARVCPDAARRVEEELTKPAKKAVIACEGSCISGEVARLAANMLAYDRQRDSAIRICLGDASTGDSGMVSLVRRAPEVIALEGCPLRCGMSILKTRLPDLQPTIIDAGKLYSFDRTKYSNVFDLSQEQLEEYAKIVADHAEHTCFLATP